MSCFGWIGKTLRKQRFMNALIYCGKVLINEKQIQSLQQKLCNIFRNNLNDKKLQKNKK